MMFENKEMSRQKMSKYVAQNHLIIDSKAQWRK